MSASAFWGLLAWMVSALKITVFPVKPWTPEKNFWNLHCFATNQKLDKAAEDNRQTAAWISHDLIRNNELGFSFTTNLQFYCSNTEIVFFLYFSLFYVQRIDCEWYV